jgi:exopolyphosphatase / guanosine-5'-triphosphate,3'-diphosphate pyrophosphatase
MKELESRDEARQAERGKTGGRTVAVIELGTTSIRMAVAQIGRNRQPVILDSLQQPVALGKDTFSRGSIERPVIESCVKALRNFGRVLEEYGIRSESDIQAVATSAMREASNRDAVLDRIYIGAGIAVRVIDQAEISRYMYLAVRPVLEAQSFWKRSDTVVVELGGGSTEAMTFRRGRVGSSFMFRIGSLRIRKMLDDYRFGIERQNKILRSTVEQFVGQIADSIGPLRNPTLIALGGEARFACSWLNPGWDLKGLARIGSASLARLTRDVLGHTADEIVRQYEITYPDADTVGPVLLAYSRLAARLGLRQIHVCDASLRNGVLNEMAAGGAWTEEFKQQIINSALELGRKYDANLRHAQYVARISSLIFAAMQDEHRLDPRYGVLLHVAALLHEAGQFIGRSSHHKHSMYIILGSDLFGLGSDDIMLTALVARYHRRAHPNPAHEHYIDLDREDRIRVTKLAAILRVADSLDTGNMQRVTDPQVRIVDGRLVIASSEAQDFTLERMRLREKAQLFELVYGMEVALQG